MLAQFVRFSNSQETNTQALFVRSFLFFLPVTRIATESNCTSTYYVLLYEKLHKQLRYSLSCFHTWIIVPTIEKGKTLPLT